MSQIIQLAERLCAQASGQAEAIILFAGDRFHRINRVAELYRSASASHVIVTSRADDWEYGSVPASLLVPKLIEAGVKAADIVWEETARNTREEADAALRIARDHQWRSLSLVTTNYHLPRTFLTVLRAMHDLAYSVDLQMAPVLDVPRFKQQSESELFDQEMARICLYQEKGDIAAWAEGDSYLDRACTSLPGFFGHSPRAAL